MMFLGNAFTIVIYISLIGSIFTVLSLLAKKVLSIALPLWYSICGIAFFLIPIILPALYLIPPEEQQWVYGYRVSCVIWLVGIIAFILYYSARSILAYCALRRYSSCDDERIERILLVCAKTAGIKHIPSVYFGTLPEPACVVTILHSSLILNRCVVQQLTDTELSIVLCHEMTHLRRKHPIYQALFDAVCIVHWFNPFAWIAKSDFAVQCEIDCDRTVLSVMKDKITKIEYATALLRLLELSAKVQNRQEYRLAALAFIMTKQRMVFVLNIPSKCKREVGLLIMTVFLAATLLFSAYASRTYFYPYPAYNTGTEYADAQTNS